MKTTLSLILLATVFGLSAFSPEPARAEADLKVGVYQAHPLVFMDKGRARGIYPDLINHIADKHDWRINYIPCQWNDCLRRLEAGELDLMTGIAYTPERAKRFGYTWEDVLVEWGQVYVRPDSKIKTLLDLEGRSVAVLTGDILYDSLRSLTNRFNIQCRFIEVPKLAWVLDMVRSGRVDAGAVNRLFGLRHGDDFGLVASPIIYNPLSLRIASRKDLPQEILTALSNDLARMKQTQGSIYYSTLEHWLGHSHPAGRLPVWIIWSLAGVVLLGLLALVLAAYLRWQVKVRTAEVDDRNRKLEASLVKLSQVEKDLTVQKNWLEEVIENAPEAIVISDLDQRIVQINDEFSRLFGWSFDEAKGRKLDDLIVPEDRQAEARGLSLQARRGGRVKRETVRRRKDGAPVDVDLSAGPVRSASGDLGYLAIYRNISRRKAAQRELDNQRERLAVTLRSIGDGVITTDIQGRVALINRAAEEMTGWPSNEAIGWPVETVMPVVDNQTGEPAASEVRRILDGGTAVELLHDAGLVSRTGRQIPVARSCAPIHDRDGRVVGAVIVFRNASADRERENEQVRAAKMDSLGVLAGGIAHDFNNILSGVIGHISLALHRAQGDRQLVHNLEEAEHAALRAKGLTRQLLTFSSGGAPIKASSSIVDIIASSLEFALVGSNVDYRLEAADDLWPAEVDVEQIGQVMNNLIINADQAMAEGGTITVRAANAELTEGHPSELAPGRYVRVTVTDQGPGIPTELRAKVFDPYFSTKEGGSGLGLSTAYSIVGRHGGHMSLRERSGGGAEFTILLPAGDRPIGPDDATDGGLPPSGQGRVLIMDDEAVVIEVASEMLTALGYRVEAAVTGEEALRYYLQAMAQEDRFDVVIMDLTIPGGMGGKEAVAKLREIDPRVKAIVSSGYFNDPVMSNYADYGFVGVVAKPYRLTDLAQAVDEAIKAESV